MQTPRFSRRVTHTHSPSLRVAGLLTSFPALPTVYARIRGGLPAPAACVHRDERDARAADGGRAGPGPVRSGPLRAAPRRRRPAANPPARRSRDSGHLQPPAREPATSTSRRPATTRPEPACWRVGGGVGPPPTVNLRTREAAQVPRIEIAAVERWGV